MDYVGAIVNEIISLDKMLGDLSQESLLCAENGYYMAALACMFISVEQSVKMALNVTEGNFATMLIEAKNTNLITLDEFAIIDRMRDLRNKMFHENHYGVMTEKNGLFWLFSEDETKRMLFNDFSLLCFNVVLKLLKGQKLQNKDEFL